MKICSTFQPTFLQNNQNKNNSVPNKNIVQFIPDNVSFGAMKKSDFKGIDRICVERFKAPIEKFNTNEDLQNWAGKLLDTIIKKDYKGRQQATVIQRKSLLKEWGDYVTKENDAYNNSAGLLIMSSITKDLKHENDALPPALNKGILADVMSEVDKGQDINILKKYKFKLKNKYFEQSKNLSMQTGWVIIPSKKHDAENFDNNVEKLKALSHNNWCTHSFNAEPYLAEGDFHVYLEKGKPKLGVRFVGPQIQEIQGESNNSKIPNKYFDIVKKHVKKYRLSSRARLEINNAKKVKQQVVKLGKFLKDKEDYEIFGFLGYLPNSKGSILESKESSFIDKMCKFFGFRKEEPIKLPKRKSKNITLAFYKQPNKDLSFEDLGIDENKLFQNVKKIHGKADFSRSKLDSLNNLEFISGEANFAYSQIKDLGNLKRIGGETNFHHTMIKTLGNLETIGGDVWFKDSEVVSLAKLRRIGGTAGFNESKVEDLGDLKVIEKNATFGGSQIKSLKNLQEIKGDADFSRSMVDDLGALKFVGGDADFSQSAVKDLGELESIGKDAIFEYSKIKDLKKLKNIGGTAYIGHSEIKHSDFVKIYFCNPNEYKKKKQPNPYSRLIYTTGAPLKR